jgi:hypothetical protein
MAIHCGDCWTETHTEGNYRVCSTCGTRTRLRMVRKKRTVSTKVTGRVSCSQPNQSNAPKARYTGGGVHGACHACGNATEECASLGECRG